MKPSHILLLLVIALLCVGGASWLAMKPATAASSAVAPIHAEDTVAPPSVGAQAADQLTTANSDARVAVKSPAAAAEPGPKAVNAGVQPGNAPTAVLTGRFVLHENGIPVDAALNGHVEVRAYSGGRGRRLSVPVIDSRFEIQSAPTGAGQQLLAGGEVLLRLESEVEYFNVNAPEIDGMAGLVLLDAAAPTGPPKWTQRLEPGVLDAAVAVRPAVTLTLDVLAMGMKTHLTDVDVHFVETDLSSESYPLGLPTVKFADSESSPVQIQPRGLAALKSAADLIVGARGYAWKRVKLDLTTAGGRTVELVPAGSLRVEHPGVAPKRAALRLYAGRRPFANLGLRGESTTLTGLPPGSYRASIELGDWFSDPTVLDEQEVTVVAGQEGSVSLSVEAPAIAIMAPFSGTLIVPPAWDIPQHAVSIKRLTPSATGAKAGRTFKRNTLPAVPDHDGHFTFELPELETGTYSIRYAQLNWTQVFEHPPEGTRDLRFEVPMPVDVTVRVLVEGSNESPEAIHRLYWRSKWPEGVNIGAQAAINRDPATGHFPLRAPAGKFTVSIRQRGFASDETDFDTSTGDEFVLRVRQMAVCMIELRSGDTTIPWPGTSIIEIVDPAGAAQSAGIAVGTDEQWLSLERPGSYQFKAPEVEGYVSPPPMTANLILGEVQTVVFELTPK